MYSFWAFKPFLTCCLNCAIDSSRWLITPFNCSISAFAWRSLPRSAANCVGVMKSSSGCNGTWTHMRTETLLPYPICPHYLCTPALHSSALHSHSSVARFPLVVSLLTTSPSARWALHALECVEDSLQCCVRIAALVDSRSIAARSVIRRRNSKRKRRINAPNAAVKVSLLHRVERHFAALCLWRIERRDFVAAIFSTLLALHFNNKPPASIPYTLAPARAASTPLLPYALGTL